MLAGVGLGCSGGAALAADGSVSALVYGPSGPPTPESVSFTHLFADSTDCPPFSATTQYFPLYPQNGTIPQDTQTLLPESPSQQNGTWTLATVIGCLQPNPVSIDDVKSVVVMQTGGAPEADLEASAAGNPGDLLAPSDFKNSSEVPVVTDDSGAHTIYTRPWYGTPDDNFDDQVIQNSSLPLQISVYEGAKVNFNASASPSSPVPVGTTVTFTATPTGQGGAGITWDWQIDGGAPFSTESTTSFTFGDAGVYHVAVGATSAAGGHGGHTIDMTVTSPTATTPPASKTPTPGANNGNGNNPGGTKAGTHPKPGATNSGKKPKGKHPASGKHKSAHHTTTTPAAGSGGKGTSGSSSSASASHGKTSGAKQSAHTTGPAKALPRASSRTSPLVAGRLISDVSPLPAGESPLVRVVPGPIATAPQLRRAVSASVLPALAAGLAVVLLFILGARRELAWRRPGRRVLGLGG